MILRGRAISPGRSEGVAIVYPEPFSFLGGVDGSTGDFNVRDGNITGKVFVFPNGKGSTVGSYVVYDLMVHGHAPCGLVNRSAETIVTTGAVISNVPMVDQIDTDLIRDGDFLVVDGSAGTLEIDNVRDRDVVSSMLVRNGSFLMLRRRQDAHSYPGKMSLVSGIVEPGEIPEECALREIGEETGIPVTLVSDMPVFDIRWEDTVFHVHPFLFTAGDGDVVLDPENDGYEWVSLPDFRAEDSVDGVDRIVSYFSKKL